LSSGWGGGRVGGVKLFPLVFLALVSAALGQGGLPAQPYIYVQGAAEAEKPADMVELRFSVIAVAPDQRTVNAEVQAKAKKVLAMLDATGIAERDVTASGLEVEPQFEEDDDNVPRRRGGLRKIIGYDATRGFEVTLRDLSKFVKLVDDLLALPIDDFDGISEKLSNEKQFHETVQAEAIANARKDAEKTAAASGVKVGQVFAVSPINFGEIHSAIFGEGGHSESFSKSVVQQPDPRAYRFAPVKVSEHVHVIFLIDPLK
jgi:uncharacterized protein YggE